ncbi:maleylacetoacetate isomerase [Phaeobacter sp.]|uniref:maleylacetoacetate isomerase n=1 Tax=Phaeobacter sp. TaxID=1902409 RepID=UPI0025D072D6|nr:maleylacetoacetate isomerase [Phaeobacter sp.]
MTETVLFHYWRSSASYRVRIALNLAHVPYRAVEVDLQNDDQRTPEHLARNPQGFVPVLDIDGHRLCQSLAIVDYLDQTRSLSLLPAEPAARAQLLALAQILAIDIHPICNLQVLRHVQQICSDNTPQTQDWMQRFIRPGLAAFAAALGSEGDAVFCCGTRPSLADICLIPQLYNARRWGVRYDDLPRLCEIEDRCNQLQAFQDAHPDAV